MNLHTFPTQNCLADCLTKASANADNLITAVKTGRLLDTDVYLNFRTLMEHKPSCRPGAEHFLPQYTGDSSCINSTRRIESRCCEKNICICRLTHQLLLDDSVTVGENNVFVLGSYDFFFSVCRFSLQRCDHVIIKFDWCCRVSRWTRKAADQRRDNNYFEALALSWHNIDLVFVEENMKREILTKRLKTQALIQAP